ncbi:MAG: hypothetical protein L0387_24890 [Acidobacteria bacterium]|nr:hypothetical protein [Acidobacteriota bacterium]
MKSMENKAETHALLKALPQSVPAGCWIWPGKKSREGYGIVAWRGWPVFAHQVSYELFRGLRDHRKGKELRHVCPGGPNRACFNPWHVELGSHGENMRDMVRDGRAYQQKRQERE